MIKKRLSSLIILIFIATKLFAQEEIKFDSIQINFGNIYECPPKASREFRFKNIGKNTFYITDVRTTSMPVNYSKGPVAPGETRIITYIYYTKHRIGPFEKNIWVHYTSKTNKEGLIIITAKGNVLPCLNATKNK